MPSASSAAFQHALSTLNHVLVQRPLSCPAPRQVMQRVARWGQRPLRGRDMFQHHRLFLAILNRCRPCQNPGIRIHRVMQRHVHFARNIFHLNFDGLRADRIGLHNMQHQIPVAISKGHLQRRFREQSRSPPRIFLRSCCVCGIERCPLRIGVGCRDFIVRSKPSAPVQRLQLLPLVDAECVRNSAAIEAKHPLRLRERSRSSSKCQHQHHHHKIATKATGRMFHAPMLAFVARICRVKR